MAHRSQNLLVLAITSPELPSHLLATTHLTHFTCCAAGKAPVSVGLFFPGPPWLAIWEQLRHLPHPTLPAADSSTWRGTALLSGGLGSITTTNDSQEIP